METLEPLLAEHPFFKGLSPAHLQVIVGCASNVRFDAGQYIFHEGEEASTFYVIRRGRVAVEIFVPGRHHGLIGGRLRRVLPLPGPGRKGGVISWKDGRQNSR